MGVGKIRQKFLGGNCNLYLFGQILILPGLPGTCF